MLNVSNQFLELLKSNVRPKCEPTITVKDALGDGRDLVWSAKNITKMTYKRGIDPVGRTLPFMELRWTEIYKGSLNENNYPQIYENVASFLPVELKFSQSLGFFNTWYSILNSGKTWKEILEHKKSWKNVKTEAEKEEFVFPIMFLSGKPTVENNEIEWVAYDLMHFLDVSQTKIFYTDAKFWNVIAFFLKNCCSAYHTKQGIIDSIKKTIDSLPFDSNETLEIPIIFDDSTNNLLKDYLSAYNMYWDFEGEKIVNKTFFDSFCQTSFEIPLKLQYNIPTIDKNDSVSSYQYKEYYTKENEANQYELEHKDYKRYKKGDGSFVYVYHYIFNDYGRIVGINSTFTDEIAVVGGIKEAFVICEKEFEFLSSVKVVVNPIEVSSLDFLIQNNNVGTQYIEDNKLSVFVSDKENKEKKNENICRYFNSKCDLLEVNCAPNVALETGDIVKIETNLKDGFDRNIEKYAVVIENVLEYSGKLSQEIKAHEVKI